MTFLTLRARATPLLAVVCAMAVGWSWSGGAAAMGIAPEIDDDFSTRSARSSACDTQTSNTRRIITLAPNLTEIVFALGVGDSVVGVTEYCRYPPEAALRARVGGLHNPNMEVMLALRPSLVVAYPSHGVLVEALQRKGIRVMVLPVESLADIRAAVLALGGELGAPSRAVELNERMERDLAAVVRRVGGRKPPRVLLIVSHTPGSLTDIYAAGQDTFLDELIRLAGGKNALEGTSARYPMISRELLIAHPPDVIVDCLFTDVGAATDKDIEAAGRAFSALLGSRLGTTTRLEFATRASLTIPGTSVAQSVSYLADLIHGTADVP